MADNTSRMVALMGALRKGMNGAVLDTFRCYGAEYGLNYGVAIHTLRDMATEIGRDDEFAHYLYLQQVRELRIIALWCGEPEKVCTLEDIAFWGEGIINSEVAEQAAQALLCKVPAMEVLLKEWCRSEKALLTYSALLAASRAEGLNAKCAIEAILDAEQRFPDNRLVGQGAVALASSLIKENRQEIERLLTSLGDTPTAQLIREEVAWRLEYEC